MTEKKETKIQQNSEDIKPNPALELFGLVTTVHVSKILSLGAHVYNTSVQVLLSKFLFLQKCAL